MARLPRLTLPGYPHHIIQRGNNRQMIFADTQDFATMMALLAENAHKFAVAVHAYVLMDNSSVRLKVEQIQLVSDGCLNGLGSVGLQGA